MIVEMRSYDLRPGTVAEVEKRFEEALPVRTKFSPLAAFWHTEVGPLNRVIHVWAYDNLDQRTETRAAAAKTGQWPPKIGEFCVNLQSEILIPAPFSPPLEPRELGGIYEIRSYTLAPGGIPGQIERWSKQIGERVQTLTPRCLLVFRNRPAQQMGAHLGVQGRRRAQPHPRRSHGQGRLAPARRTARQHGPSGKHAGRYRQVSHR